MLTRALALSCGAQVAENVATAVVLKAQADGLARKPLGKGRAQVASALKAAMWSPPTAQRPPAFRRTASDMGGVQVAYAR